MYNFLTISCIFILITIQQLRIGSSDHCNAAESCFGDTIASTNVSCRGYLSCSVAEIDSTVAGDGNRRYMFTGAMSGIFGDIQTSWITSMNGYLALFNTNYHPFGGFSWCLGASSCVYSNITYYTTWGSYITIWALGARSFSHSNVTIVNENDSSGGTKYRYHIFYGAFTLYNTMYSLVDVVSTLESNVEMQFWLHGSFMAGYNSTIDCGGGNGDSNTGGYVLTCYLMCAGTSCYNLDFKCIEDDYHICTIDCDNSIGDICPTLNGNIYDNNSTDCYDYSFTDESTDDLENLINTLNNKFLDISGGNNYRLIPPDRDIYDEIANTDDIDDQIDRIENLRYNNVECVTYACDDYKECMNSDIEMSKDFNTNNESICCRGQSSCESSDITITSDSISDLFCDGSKSCVSSIIEIDIDSAVNNINNGKNVYVGGYYGISESKIYFNNPNKIDATNTVFCSGSYSCRKSTISGNKNLVCDAVGSCIGSQIINVNNIYDLAYYSIRFLEINFDSTMTYSNELNIYLYSISYLHSFDGLSLDLNVTCDNNTNCTIHCLNGNCPNQPSDLGTFNCNCKVIEDVTIFNTNDCQGTTSTPTPKPTEPTNTPTIHPTITPSDNPTSKPTNNPSVVPTNSPTNKPSDIPSVYPTITPTGVSISPTNTPTNCDDNSDYFILGDIWEMYLSSTDETLVLNGKYIQDGTLFIHENNPNLTIWFENVGTDYVLIVGDYYDINFELVYIDYVSTWTDNDNPLIDSNDEFEWDPVSNENIEYVTGNMTLFDCNDENLGTDVYTSHSHIYYGSTGIKRDLYFGKIGVILLVTVFSIFTTC